jgi:hypothetical protein
LLGKRAEVNQRRLDLSKAIFGRKELSDESDDESEDDFDLMREARAKIN